MATAAVQLPSSALNLGGAQAPTAQQLQAAAAVAKPAPQARDVRTTLNFYKPNADGSPPHPTYVGRPETYDRPVEPHDMLIRDVRGSEERHTLDGSGFQFHRHVATEKEFVDEDKIRASYYPETEQLLKDVTGASRVFIFDHTIRRPAPDAAAATTTTGGVPLRGPIQRVHIDQSYTASLSRVPHHLPDEAATLMRGRVQIINVWRPIRRVDRDPLAVAEARSVREEDLVPTGLIYPTRRGETLQVRFDEGQRWFYKSAMAPDEVLLIKCFDSKVDGRARRVPHTAFADPDAPADAPARESLEVRALVFHPEDTE